jgi:hypothetical protein
MMLHRLDVRGTRGGAEAAGESEVAELGECGQVSRVSAQHVELRARRRRIVAGGDATARECQRVG